MRKESRGEPERQKLVMERQLLGLSSVNNARQLGGYRIGGKRVRPDVLLRSGALARLSAEDAALLRDRYRVCCVYDLRSETTFLLRLLLHPVPLHCLSPNAYCSADLSNSFASVHSRK